MRFVCCFLIFSATALRAEEAKPSAEQTEFFETKVRPLLIDNCFACHGEKKQSGSLRLDSRKTILEGGDTGPAAVPGDPTKSLFIKAIRHAGELKMPEKSKLADDKIEILTAWVKMGLPYPEKSAVVSKAEATAAAKNHWAYKPRATPTGNSIDGFIEAKLQAQKMTLNPTADKRTLIRRLYFDLLGLPPKPEEIEAFEKDTDPKAYEKLIDKLLASPHYGERWGRHWLDYARYADTRGYLAGGADRNYPYAYTYRDWVVKALNADMPYDRFVKLQIAADKYTKIEEPADLAAMGFLTVGRRFLGNNNDVIDDRIDVVCRTFLGLTVTCARCHDHKFDPIPTKDYYSLYGVFNSSVEPADLPLLEKPKQTPEMAAFEKELAARKKALDDHMTERRNASIAKLSSAESLTKYLLNERQLRSQTGEKLQGVFREKDMTGLVFTRVKQIVNDSKNASIFSLWTQLAALPADSFEAKAAEQIESAGKLIGKKATNPLVLKALQAKKPKTLAEAADALAKALAEATEAKKKSPEQEELAKLITGPNGIAIYAPEELLRMFNTAERNKMNNLKAKIEEWNLKSPVAPPRAMVMNDSPNPGDARIQIRGNPGNPGAIAPRQFLEILSTDRKPFKEGSGRRELAEAIANKDNPLTARVMVNRVWLLHFGQGIVRTPSDFGVRSETPTHPELLDWLAGKFIEEGWSIKKLHKQILLSRTYRQTSEISDVKAKADPENRLLSRQNRRRLDFESLRDSLLATSGKLDETMGGKPVDLFKDPLPERRTIYGHVDRQNLPGTFRMFDFASPDAHSAQRFQTTVPQQALYLMNSPFLAQQAKALIDRSEVARESDPKHKVEEMIRVVYGRKALPREVDLSLQYINAKVIDKPTETIDLATAWQYGYGSVDAKSGKVDKFTKYPHWTGTSWQGAMKLPNAISGWSLMNEKGGHAGANPNFCTIRRWTAPAKMEIEIQGRLKHPNKDGDGVQGRIVSSRTGILLAKSVFNNAEDTMLKKVAVEKGETIDFVIDCIKNENSDSFLWTTTIRQIGGTSLWDSARDFRGPPAPVAPAITFTNWEQLAQVLLLSNEFSFVD